MKQCSNCKSYLPFRLFSVRKASADGLAYVCKSCYATYQREHRKVADRKQELAHRYGLSEKDYQTLVGSVDTCEICEKEMVVPHVDHDKLTGNIRGILCMQCNMALGLLMHDPTTIRRAALYLECRGKYETT